MADGNGTTHGVRMAKASDADLNAAYDLAGFCESVQRGYYPATSSDVDHPLWLDGEDIDHLKHVHKRLVEILNRGSLFRVVGGLATLLSESNAIVDPDADCLELHPRIKEALAPAWTAMDAETLQCAGRYLVSDGTEVREARWQPRLKTWRFPSAAAALATVTHWRPMPTAPSPKEIQG